MSQRSRKEGEQCRLGKEAWTQAALPVGKIVLGNLFITGAYAFITVPKHIVNGGVTSFAMVLENFLPVEITVITNVITVLLLVISLCFLGKVFLMKSLLSSVCYMGFFSVLNEAAQKISFSLPMAAAVVLASILVGTGYYLCISAGSSTVGFDVLALVAHKKNPALNVALLIRYINYGVLFLGITAYGVWAIVLGIIFTYLKTTLLNYLLKREEKKQNSLKESENAFSDSIGAGMEQTEAV